MSDKQPPEAPAAPTAPEAPKAPDAPAIEPYRTPAFTATLTGWLEGKDKPTKPECEGLLGDLRTQVASLNALGQQHQQATQATQELQSQIFKAQGQVDAISRMLHRFEFG